MSVVWSATALVALAAEPAVVVLTVDGPAAEVAALTESLSELVSRHGVEVQPEAEDPLARVSVELGGATSIISVLDRGGELVARRVLSASKSRELAIESVAFAVAAMLEELVGLEAAPVRRQPLSPAGEPARSVVVAASPASAPPARRSASVELGAVLTARALASAAPAVFGGGLVASVDLLPGGVLSPRFTLAATYNGPVIASDELVSVNLQSFSARLGGGAAWAPGPGWSLALELGGGVDGLVATTASNALPPQALARPRLVAAPVVGAWLEARFALTPRLGVLVMVAVDVDLLPRRFVRDIQGETTVLLEAWRVRPWAAVGVSFDLGAR